MTHSPSLRDRATAVIRAGLSALPSVSNSTAEWGGPESAAIALTTSMWAHLRGLSVSQIRRALEPVVPGGLEDERVRRALRGLRGAESSGFVAAHLSPLWIATVTLISASKPELGARLDGVRDLADVEIDWEAHRRRTDSDSLPPPPIDDHSPLSSGLKVNGHLLMYEPGFSYLDPYRRAIVTHRGESALPGWLDDLEARLTVLECLLLYPTAEEERALQHLAHELGRWKDIPNIVEWGEAGESAPSRILEWVFAAGGRHGHSTTGAIHEWFVVATDGWERERCERLLREVRAIGIAEYDGGLTLSLVAPSASQPDDNAAMQFFYDKGSLNGVRGLLLLTLAERFRLEVYTADHSGVSCLGVTDIVLPQQLRDLLTQACLSIIGDGQKTSARLTERLRRRRLEEAGEQAEARFWASENARYEQLWQLSAHVPVAESPPELRARLKETRETYLAHEADAAQAWFRSQTPDPPWLAHSRTAFRDCLAEIDHGRLDRDILAGVLRDEQVFLHMELRDGGVDFVWATRTDPQFAMHTSETAATAVERLWNFGELLHRGTNVESDVTARRRRALAGVLDAWTDILAPVFEAVKASGDQLIVSGGAMLDRLPVHLLDDAPEAVTYAPSVALLGALNDLYGHGTAELSGAPIQVYEAGHLRGNELPAAIEEAETIAALYTGSASRLIRDAGPNEVLESSMGGIVHVACHGVVGPTAMKSGLLLSQGGAPILLSAAEILRNGVFLGTQLVYLSACSTSVAVPDETGIQGMAGPDGVFLASGARTVVAPLWDLNDAVGAVFAITMHRRLQEVGDILDAYKFAQHQLRSGAASRTDWPPAIMQGLNNIDLSRPEYWGSFRLSGYLSRPSH